MVAASEGKGSRLISRTMLQRERGVGEREREKLNRILGKKTPGLQQKIHPGVAPKLVAEHVVPWHLLHLSTSNHHFPLGFAAPLPRTTFVW